jgi:DNA-binding Lrp family transcriptional regulator
MDRVDRILVRELDRDPRSPVITLAEHLGLARRTVQSRLSRLEEGGAYRPHSTRVEPRALGYGEFALIHADVEQACLSEAVAALAQIPQVLQVGALAGQWDLLCQVVARDSDHLYEIGQLVLGCPGIRRTTTTLMLRNLVPYRTEPLLNAGSGKN